MLEETVCESAVKCHGDRSEITLNFIKLDVVSMLKEFVILISFLITYIFCIGTILSIVYRKKDIQVKKNKISLVFWLIVALGISSVVLAYFKINILQTSIAFRGVPIPIAVAASFFGVIPTIFTIIFDVLGYVLQEGTFDILTMYAIFVGILGIFIATRSWKPLTKGIVLSLVSPIIWTICISTMHTVNLLQVSIVYALLCVSGVTAVLLVVQFMLQKFEAEEELYKSEQWHRSLYENQDSATFFVSVDGLIEGVNKAAINLYGYTEEELIGESLTKITLKEEWEAFQQRLKKVLTGNKTMSQGIKIHKDGTYIEVIAQMIPLTIHEKVAGIIAVTEDITLLKQAEKNVIEKKERYRSLFEEHSIPMLLLRLDGVIEEVNTAFVKLYGYEVEDIIGRVYTDIILESQEEDSFEEFEQLRVGTDAVDVEKIIIHRSGRKMDVLINRSPIVVKGETVGIIGTLKDLTKQKLLKRQQEESKKVYRSLFDNHPEGIIIVSLGYIQEANASACRLLRVSASEIVDRHVKEFIGEDVFHKLNAEEISEDEVQIITPDKTAIDVNLSLSPVLVNGERIATYVVFKDISEEKSQERQITESESWHRSLVELSPEVIFVEQKNGIEFMNKGIVALLKMKSIEDVTGNSLVDFVHEEDKETISKYIYSLLEENNEDDFISGIQDVRFVCADGSIVSATVAMKKISYDDMPVLLGIIHDTTQQKELEAKIALENEKLANLSRIDDLTNIGNRRAYEEQMTLEWQQAMNEQEISVVMIDIDYFKQYNDTYGHQAGDDCLKKMAQLLNSTIRCAGDFISRYGGEEFIIILPHTNQEEALFIAEKIRQRVEQEKIPHESSKSNKKFISVSLGVSTIIPTINNSSEELVRQADKALYKAKHSGRNKVCYK